VKRCTNSFCSSGLRASRYYEAKEIERTRGKELAVLIGGGLKRISSLVSPPEIIGPLPAGIRLLGDLDALREQLSGGKRVSTQHNARAENLILQ
jgi:hypothetical protein